MVTKVTRKSPSEPMTWGPTPMLGGPEPMVIKCVGSYGRT